MKHYSLHIFPSRIILYRTGPQYSRRHANETIPASNKASQEAQQRHIRPSQNLLIFLASTSLPLTE